MKKKNSIGLGSVILFWASAILWSVKCVMDLFRGQLQGLDPIIAVLWCLIAIKWTKRYLEENGDGEEDDI